MMKLGKKLLSLGIVASLVVGITACSSTTTEDTNKSEIVNLTFARGKDANGSTTKLIEAFEKTHPNIKIHFKEMPADSGQNHDQLVTMLSSKSSEIDVI